MHDIRWPPHLFELQSWFAHLMTSPLEKDDPPIPLFHPALIDTIRKKIAPSPTLTSEERLGIYKQQYWWRLIALCQEDFPSLVRLLGYETFNHVIAEPYLLQHPPKDWFLPHLGRHLPQWIKKHVDRDDAWLLAQLAQIELAYLELFFTTDAPALDMHAVEKKWILQPTVRLFRFSEDLFSFRSLLLQQRDDLPSISKRKRNRCFVLYRGGYKEVSLPLFRVLLRFKKGARLEDLTPLLEKVPDLEESFQCIAAHQWLTNA